MIIKILFTLTFHLFFWKKAQIALLWNNQEKLRAKEALLQ
jgi:hypothetical protein